MKNLAKIGQTWNVRQLKRTGSVITLRMISEKIKPSVEKMLFRHGTGININLILLVNIRVKMEKILCQES